MSLVTINLCDQARNVLFPTSYDGLTEEQIATVTASIEENNRLTSEINLSPNPARYFIA